MMTLKYPVTALLFALKVYAALLAAMNEKG
jgi:hypothetical protein